MNKRIQELAKQSGWKTDRMSAVNAFAQQQKLEKLAQLIVEECAEVASDYDGAHYVGTAIKKHFGVEK